MTVSHKECANCASSLKSSFDCVTRVKIEVFDDADDSTSKVSRSWDTPASKVVKSTWKNVKVKKILSTLYKLEYLENFETPDNENEEDITICNECAWRLLTLYKFYEDFGQRRSTGSSLATKVSKLDTLVNQLKLVHLSLSAAAAKTKEIINDDKPLVVLKKTCDSQHQSPQRARKKIDRGSSITVCDSNLWQGPPAFEEPLNFMDIDDDPVSPPDQLNEDPLATTALFDHPIEEQPIDMNGQEVVAEIIKCPLCRDSFSDPSSLADHVYNQHGNNLATCPILTCQRIVGRLKMQGHIREHFGVSTKRSTNNFLVPHFGPLHTFAAPSPFEYRSSPSWSPAGIAGATNQISAGLAGGVRPKLLQHILQKVSLKSTVQPQVIPQSSQLQVSAESSQPQAIPKSVQSQGNGIDSVQCSICSIAYESQPDLVSHLLDNHTNSKNPACCPICKIRVNVKTGPTTMKDHLAWHVKSRKDFCQSCPYCKMPIETDLAEHIKMHTNSKSEAGRQLLKFVKKL